MADKKLDYVPYFAVKGWMGVSFVSNPNRGSIIIGQPEEGFRTKKQAQAWYKDHIKAKGVDLTGGKMKRHQKAVNREVKKIDDVKNPKRKRMNSDNLLTSLINKKYRK